MVALVTTQMVKDRLHIEHTDDDGIIGGYIEAASAAVINYLKGSAAELLGVDSPADYSDSPPTIANVPAAIATATIMLVGYWYRNPDSDPDKDFEMGYLPKPVMSLLYPLRDPALA